MISGDENCRAHGLLEIAKEVGAMECVSRDEEALAN
ncbi:MAG: hypothetical protein ACI9K5_004191 [Gammaproteobacteria bacterium]|jgi:hypothetical protein